MKWWGTLLSRIQRLGQRKANMMRRISLQIDQKFFGFRVFTDNFPRKSDKGIFSM